MSELYHSVVPLKHEKALRIFHVVLSVIHTVQGVVVAANAHRSAVFPVFYNYWLRVPRTSEFKLHTENVGSVNLAALLCLFSFGAAIDHLATSVLAKRFHMNLSRRLNPFQWIEYFFTASIMAVVIALECAILDVLVLMLLAFLMATTMVFGWIYERTNSLTYFYFGCIPYIVYWIYIFSIFGTAVAAPESQVPNFVWAIIFSLFILMSLFPIAQVYQRGHYPFTTGKQERMQRYVKGSVAFLVLSLVAKGLLGILTVTYAFR